MSTSNLDTNSFPRAVGIVVSTRIPGTGGKVPILKWSTSLRRFVWSELFCTPDSLICKLAVWHSPEAPAIRALPCPRLKSPMATLSFLSALSLYVLCLPCTKLLCSNGLRESKHGAFRQVKSQSGGWGKWELPVEICSGWGGSGLQDSQFPGNC